MAFRPYELSIFNASRMESFSRRYPDVVLSDCLINAFHGLPPPTFRIWSAYITVMTWSQQLRVVLSDSRHDRTRLWMQC